jgi:hypothetical protein
VADDALDTLRRWEDAGGQWRVVAERKDSVVVALERCDGGEEIDRIEGRDRAFVEYVTSRGDGSSVA